MAGLDQLGIVLMKKATEEKDDKEKLLDVIQKKDEEVNLLKEEICRLSREVERVTSQRRLVVNAQSSKRINVKIRGMLKRVKGRIKGALKRVSSR